MLPEWVTADEPYGQSRAFRTWLTTHQMRLLRGPGRHRVTARGMPSDRAKERSHPGAQLRIPDIDGHRITAFAINTPTGGPGTQLPELKLRHRRARAQDRIRCAKDNGRQSPAADSSTTRSTRYRAPRLHDHHLGELLVLAGHQADVKNPNDYDCTCCASPGN